jgi:amidase
MQLDSRQISTGSAAVAGYPHLTVPMGVVRGLPVGLSFMGAKWSDARILSFGYAYEQASRALAHPRFLPSVEQSPPVLQQLRPQHSIVDPAVH